MGGGNAASNRPVSLPAAEVVKLHGEPRIVFIDVRSPGEIAQSGTIHGAIRMPLNELPAKSGSIAELQGAERIVFVCASGMRSGSAAQLLAGQGFEGIVNIADGFGAWLRAGGPSER
jgi:rhodanese-related sulfurtransferase